MLCGASIFFAFFSGWMKREQCEISETKIELDRTGKRLREEENSLSSKKKKFNEDVANFNKRNEAFKLHLKEYRERKEFARASAAQLPHTPVTKEPAPSPSAQFDALALTYPPFAEFSLSDFQALTCQELEELFVDCKVSTIHKAKFRNLHNIMFPVLPPLRHFLLLRHYHHHRRWCLRHLKIRLLCSSTSVREIILWKESNQDMKILA
jgi:hypothetical protein